MSFDWIAFLTRYNIEFTTASRYHVTAGNVGINCIWCAHDTGYNLHISLEGKGYHCFRVSSHRGFTPQRLIQALLKCPFSLADSLVNSSVDMLPNDTDFITRLTDLFKPEYEERVEVTELNFPKSFVPIRNSGSGRMFCTYMAKRGFDCNLPKFCEKYNLLCCSDTSRWHGRIIFPVVMNNRLLTWTGRHIGRSAVRYRTLSPTDPDTPAVCRVKDTILWSDMLRNYRGTLVVCEGPFDALKVNYLGWDDDIYATSLFGKSASSKQVELLSGLDNFSRRILLLDAGVTDQFDAKSNFSLLLNMGFELKILPPEVSDPGEFNRQSFAKVFH